MSDLERTFGSEFADQVSQKMAQRRQERESASEESLRRIAHLAKNEGKLDANAPHFTYSADSGVTHDVLLMQVPELENGSVWDYVNKLDSGAVTIPMVYPDSEDWMSCLFNDREEVERLEEGQFYIVVGNLDTWQPDDGEEQEQVSPARGLLTMDEVDEYAKQSLEGEGFGGGDEEDTSDEEPSSDDEEEDTSDDEGGSSDGGGLFDDDAEDEEEDEEEEVSVDYSDVASEVEALAEDEPEVWEVSRDHDHFETLVKVVCDELDLDTDDSDVVSEVQDHIMQRVEEESEGEDDEEDTLFGG